MSRAQVRNDEYLLLALWRDGDENAGDELYRRYYDMLFDFLASAVADRNARMELALDTFTACREAHDKLVPDIDFGVYLLLAAERTLRAWRIRERSGSLPRAGFRISLNQHVKPLLLLSSVDVALLRIHDDGDLSIDEIAEILEIPAADLPIWLSRTRRKLADEMSALDDGQLRRLAGARGAGDQVGTQAEADAALTPRTQRIQLVLDGDVAQLDPDTFRRILEEAREKSGDPALSITSIRKGSILLELDISAEAAATLEKLFESGDLKSLGGLPIRAIKRVQAELPGVKSAEIFERADVALTDFLVSAFAADELRRFVHGFSDGARLAAALPGASASLSQLAFEVVRVLGRHGLVGPALFERLEAERPNRRDELRRLRQRFEDTAASETS